MSYDIPGYCESNCSSVGLSLVATPRITWILLSHPSVVALNHRGDTTCQFRLCSYGQKNTNPFGVVHCSRVTQVLSWGCGILKYHTWGVAILYRQSKLSNLFITFLFLLCLITVVILSTFKQLYHSISFLLMIQNMDTNSHLIKSALCLSYWNGQ